MHWSDWVVIAFMSLGTILTIGLVGRPREPIEPGAAILSLIVTASITAALLMTH